jgi:transcriptional regulator with XRE-family HTH domain
MNAFGNLIRRARSRRGMTLETLARYLGCSVQYLSDVERGQCPPLAPQKMRIAAQVLGLDQQELDVVASVTWGRVSVDGLTVEQIREVADFIAVLRIGGSRDASEGGAA